MSAATLHVLPGVRTDGEGAIGRYYGVNLQVSDVAAAIAAGLVLV